MDPSGSVYIGGATQSADFPVDPPPVGMANAYIIKIGVPQDIFFPEIAVGGGWTTTFALVNTGAAAVTGNLLLYNQQGNPLLVSSLELGIDSSFPISIPPGGVMFLTVDALSIIDPSQHGWAKAEYFSGNLSGVATYQFASEGTVTALAGVLPTQPMQFATVPINTDVDTAFAVANPTGQGITVALCLVDKDGKVIDDTVTIPLAAGEQIARYFSQYLALSDGTVVLKAQSGGTFVAVALIQDQALFTVVPVIEGKAPHIPD
jgi:hypothetical protein